MPSLRVIFLIIALVMWPAKGGLVLCANAGDRDPSKFQLQRDDVVAFLGAGDVASAQFTGHLEALFAIEYAQLGVRCRNFGWEGDTVFAQPRDVGFPPLNVHLQRAGVNFILLQFGRSESLLGETNLAHFVEVYGRMLDDFSGVTARMVLVTPPPFEKGGGYLPDMSVHNADLANYARAIVALAKSRNLAAIDLFTELRGKTSRGPRLTSDGLQLTPSGHGIVAAAFMRAAGFDSLAHRAQNVDQEGRWKERSLEKVRQAILVKDRLWFNYWRPENWAFLGGDRTEQPSSRDYRDPKIRWFPSEMEKYVPLIHDAEDKIREATLAVKP